MIIAIGYRVRSRHGSDLRGDLIGDLSRIPCDHDFGTDESRTVAALPVVRRCFEGQIVFDPHHVVVVATGDFADALERLGRIHPAERDAFDLDERPGRVGFLPEYRVLLHAVGARRIIQEQAAGMFESGTACPRLPGELAGKLLGVFLRNNGKAAVGVEHQAGDSPRGCRIYEDEASRFT